MRENKLCAVVVTFHPSRSDLHGLDQLSGQVEGLIVVDNGSPDATVAYLRTASARLSFELIDIGENLGLAAALNIGGRRARDRGFEWVIFFDQDSCVTPGFVDAMLHALGSYSRDSRLGILVPSYVDSRNGRPLPVPRNRKGELEFAMTSGSLMPIALLELQGWFEEGLFIGGIDFDYSLRLRRAGYLLLECREAVLLHAPSSPRMHTLFGFELFTTSNYSAVRRYYSERNRVWLRRRHLRHFPAMCLALYVSSFKEMIKVAVAENEKRKKIQYILKGIWDGWWNRMGRNDNL